jgi:hypothetical protein
MIRIFMQKKMMLLCFLFLCTTYKQFASLHHAGKLLQRFRSAEKNSAYFIDQIISSLAYHNNRPISEVRLFSQISLDKNLVNELFKLAVEEEVAMHILLNRSAAQLQLDTLSDMQEDGIDVAILPDAYRFINWEISWEGFFKPVGFKIIDDKNVKSSMIAALISYEFGSNQILICNDNGFSSLSNQQDFTDWQKKFDYVFRKSKR